ncbi:MAG: beta-ketoacyl-[acyl-carrier-protein] synthase family protein [Pseudomonadota bacterium]|nr:beta-ketoacyl-[acyl-carrier-protein] synthase family protein [Pseudomonadota bacterium]
MKRRIAITGLGVIAPLGNSAEALFSAITAGRSAIRRLTLARGQRLRSPIGAPVDFDGAAYFSPVRLRMMDRVSQLASVAADQAIADARLTFSNESREHCGISVGTSMGGVETTDEAYHNLYGERSDRVQPFSVLAAMSNAPAAWIGIDHGLMGPNLTYSTACSSSAVALGEAARRIGCGDADVMLAGGCEAPLTFGVLRAWEAMRTLATPDPIDPATSCRPFSQNRSGLVIGEGAAFVVLEEWEHARGRGAHIHAEFSGYGLTSDVAHITRPTVEGQASAMRAALRSAELDPAAIDYINAHGTATSQNDAVETAAIKEVFGGRAHSIPISSTKSAHAHLLGAAGALEFVISVWALGRGIAPPTLHLDVPDPACDLDYVPNLARTGLTLRAVMSNSFAFGGTNAVLIAEAADEGIPSK